MKGAFQISREIFENNIWTDVPKFRIFFYILGNTVFSHEGVKKGGILIKRGQYLRSYRNLCNDLEYVENRAIKKYSTSVVKRKVDQLVKEERLKIKDTELGTLFTVVNYEKYQDLQNYKSSNLERNENADGTQKEQRENNNNNVNKDNNVKNDKDYTSKIKDLLPVFSSIPNFNQLNKQYWDCIRETRTTGKVAKSVIYNNMILWQKYDPSVIEYALKSHIDQHKGKREKYTIGIMRGIKPEEAKKRLEKGISNNVVQFNKGGVKYGDGTESDERSSKDGRNVQFWT